MAAPPDPRLRRFAVGDWVMLRWAPDAQAFEWERAPARVVTVDASIRTPGVWAHNIAHLIRRADGTAELFHFGALYYGDDLARYEPTEEDETDWCLARLG